MRALKLARRNPHSVTLRRALADVLRSAAYLKEAIDGYRVVIAMDPNQSTAFRDLGNTLVDDGRPDEGLVELRRAVELMPHEPGALLGLIRTYKKCGIPGEAHEYVDRLGNDAAANEGDARRQLYHGLALSQVGRLDDAISSVRAALTLNNQDAEAWDFLGMLLADRCDWSGARAAFDRALEIAPGRAQAQFNRATLRLRLGDYRGGFSDYEGRWDSPLFTTPRRNFGVPRWQGEALHGRTLLVHTEQGLGDTLQFARFIAHAHAAGAGRVILECEASMMRLLAGLEHIDEVVRRGDPLPVVDAHAALMSLAHLAGATIDNLTPLVPYLGVDQTVRVLPPRAATTRLRIGIVFEASRSGGSFGEKSVPLGAFTPLTLRDDLELFSLQKGPGEQTLAASPLRKRIFDAGSRLVDLRDTAETLSQLDLVITVDTAVCHLAGAMGVPVWTLLPKTCDWRWLLDRIDSPWYPSMRLFRQQSAGDWSAVMAQIIGAIDQVAPATTQMSDRFAPRARLTPDVHLRIAVEHSEHGEFLEAASAYSAALTLDTTNANAWNNLGVVLAKAEHIQESLHAFKTAVDLSPTHADAVRNLHAVSSALQGSVRRAAQDDPSNPRFAIDWLVGATSGWGIYGMNLVMHTQRRREFTPVVFCNPDLSGATPLQRAALQGISAGGPDATYVKQHGGHCPFPALHALGNGLHLGSLGAQLHGTKRVGMVFLEDTRLGPDAIARGRTYDRIVAGSTWNAELLRAIGLKQTVLVIQGIDTAAFHPGPRTGVLAGRFVVYSGGKLEYRKGQDLVVAAFARFHQRHKDALLMVAWHNHWPQTMGEIVTARHVLDLPVISADGQLAIAPWLSRYGIPADAVLDLGLVSNAQLAPLVREADVGVFPNRAEGGTNLVAMETLASGVPCIISANTGHLDLTSDEYNIVLRRQDPCRSTSTFGGVDGWGESSVDEIVEALEFAYVHREETQKRAGIAAQRLADTSWHHQIDRLFDSIGDVLH